MESYFETDLDSIKEQLITFLQTQDTFKDYNFEGSAINDLLNILAYTVQYQNLYLNFTSNELFLETAQDENNVYKLANTLNYIPKRKSAAYIEVDLQRTEAVSIIIPKYSTWSVGSLQLTNLEDISITDGSVYSVQLYEGTIDTETWVSDGTEFQEYELAERENIDNDEFYVYVDEPDGAGGYITSTDRWLIANTEGFNTGDNAFFLQHFETLKIKFDDGQLLSYPEQDYQIRVVYLNTNGADANGSSGTVLLTDTNVINRDKLNITPTSTLKNGTDEESIEAIKLRAPLFYTTQNRAISVGDYNILLGKYSKYDTFHSGIIWGGEEEWIDKDMLLQESAPQKDLGHVFISALKSDYDYLDATEISDLEEYLEKFKIITIFFKYLHPVFINIHPTVGIKYLSTLDLDLTSVESQINTFLQNNDGFDKDFYLSDIIRFVDDLSDIVYCTVSYTTSFTVYAEDHKIIRLFGEITPNSISGTVGGLTLEDDGAGVINWDGSPVGTVNYTTGFITLDQDFGVTTYDVNFSYVDQNLINLERESFLKHEDITLNIL